MWPTCAKVQAEILNSKKVTIGYTNAVSTRQPLVFAFSPTGNPFIARCRNFLQLLKTPGKLNNPIPINFADFVFYEA